MIRSNLCIFDGSYYSKNVKKLFSFLATFFVTTLLFAQTDNYKTAITVFQANYNSEKYEEIFSSFSPEMQKALPLNNTKQLLSNLKTQVGKIESTEFIGITQETYAIYKTKFEKAIIALNLSLDKQDKINGLFIKPYEETSETENSNVNALNDYPAEIAKVIYSESSDFPDNTQLAIAVIQNGVTRYYGIIKQNDTLKTCKNEDKVFEIGSITKVFTSTVLASLVEQGKISLTDEINGYYPFAFKDNQKIRFENLANHTSGLPRLPDNLGLSDQNNPYKHYGRNEINSYLKDFLTLNNEPSKTYVYSNLGAGLLGYTLGLSQKTDFRELLQNTVFDKYGMKSSFVSAAGLDKLLVKGQNPKGEITSNWDFDVLFGGGGILSTAEDLVKFANAQFNPENTELALTQKPTFSVNQSMKTGLGWHILKFEKGKEIFWHNGGTGGYSSSMLIHPETRSAVIILSNVSAFHPQMKNIDDLCLKLMKQIR